MIINLLKLKLNQISQIDIDDTITIDEEYYKDTDIEWFCYDHVLMKYPLVKRFKNDSLQLVCMLEENYLVRDNKMVLGYSDHLPIRFEIEEV